MQIDRLSESRLFQRHPEQTIRRWLGQLQYFYFVRAWGGHANDADAFEVGFIYSDRQDLINKLEHLGVATEKSGRSNLFGHRAYIQVSDRVIQISIADTNGDTPYEVSEYDFQVCLDLEKQFNRLDWQNLIDRKIEESVCCISRTKYPELYR